MLFGTSKSTECLEKHLSQTLGTRITHCTSFPIARMPFLMLVKTHVLTFSNKGLFSAS